ncbi:TIGR03943 family protein [Cutibacterium avidum]|uniref:TIGR03943 family putative permease subunit n=1 Tax=Cutibacterium avidum TaxID=33010 RepID=UPI003365E1BC
MASPDVDSRPVAAESPTPVSDHPHDGGSSRAGVVAGATIVLLIGTVLLGLVAAGRLTHYLQPYFTPYITATGVFLVGLGLWTLVTQDRVPVGHRARVDRHGDEDVPVESVNLGIALPDAVDAPEHDHSGFPRSALMLLVPVALLALCAPKPLGSYVLNNRTAAAGSAQVANQASRPKAQFEPLPSGSEPTQIDIDKYWDRYVWGDPAQLLGKQVSIVGFVSHPDSPTTYSINRFKVYCCAADATSYTIHVNAGTDQPDDTWVKVTGTLSRDAEGGVPVLDVSSVTTVHEPSVPYLS